MKILLYLSCYNQNHFRFFKVQDASLEVVKNGMEFVGIYIIHLPVDPGEKNYYYGNCKSD